jgi:hypothetical protein
MFDIKPISSSKTKDGKITKFQLSKKNKQAMTTSEITKFYTKLRAKYGDKIHLRGLGPTRWSTLATFQDGLMIKEYDDYFQGTVRDNSKFDSFTDIEFLVVQ